MPPKRRRSPDWEAIHAEYRNGQLSVAEIARQHGISHTAIHKHAKDRGWVRDLSKQVRETINARLVSEEVSGATPRETMEPAVARGLGVIQTHRRDIGRLRSLAERLAEMVMRELAYVEAECVAAAKGDPLPVRSLPGIAVVLGHKESVTDVVSKLGATLHRVLPLERQAFSLDDPNSGDALGVSKEHRDAIFRAAFGGDGSA